MRHAAKGSFVRFQVGVSVGIALVGAAMAVWVGSILFARGIEVDEANGVGYSTVAEKAILFSGLGVFACGALLTLVFLVARFRWTPAPSAQ